LRNQQPFQPWTDKRSTHAHSNAVQEVAPGYVTVHPKFAVAGAFPVLIFQISHYPYAPFSCS
jgi:hypothetical protein